MRLLVDLGAVLGIYLIFLCKIRTSIYFIESYLQYVRFKLAGTKFFLANIAAVTFGRPKTYLWLFVLLILIYFFKFWLELLIYVNELREPIGK